MKKRQLWLITLPIGNDEDLTIRAKAKLKEITHVWCEDTRTFKEFCNRAQISYKDKTLISFHDHSKEGRLEQFLSLIAEHDIAYVSDAGSPYISDPAHDLVQFCLSHDIEVKNCPGVSSVITALELSGLPAIPFSFHGFLPRNTKGQSDFLEDCLQNGGTHLFFEGVSRVEKTLDFFTKTLPADTDFAVMRELTKTFETIHRFKACEWEEVKKHTTFKGEFVIGFYLKSKVKSLSLGIQDILSQMRKVGAKPKLVSKMISELTGEDQNEIYENYFR